MDDRETVFDLPIGILEERGRTRTDREIGGHVLRNQKSQLRRSLRDLQQEGFRHVWVLRSPEEVLHELERGDDELAKELGAHDRLFLPLDQALGDATAAVQAACHLTDPDGERSRGDPFVVACAQLNGWTVLSGERPRKGPNAQMRIPDACEHLKIPHLDWFTFLREMKWDL